MDLNTFVFVWLAIMAFISLFVPVKKWIPVEGKWELRWKIFWAAVVFAPIIYLASMGVMRGDTNGYVLNYLKAPGTWNAINDAIFHFKS